MTLKGNVNDLSKLSKRLKGVPLVVVHDVANRAAPTISEKARNAFTAGVTVYGNPRPRSVDNEPLSLYKTGATFSKLRFTVTGTIIRCDISHAGRHAKYLIGKYRILPMGRMPVAWTQAIRQIVQSVRVSL